MGKNMEVKNSFTGTWNSQWGNIIKETISIIHCNGLYIIMRICDIVGKDEFIPIETKQTREYTDALKVYNYWNKSLTERMIKMDNSMEMKDNELYDT